MNTNEQEPNKTMYTGKDGDVHHFDVTPASPEAHLGFLAWLKENDRLKSDTDGDEGGELVTIPQLVQDLESTPVPTSPVSVDVVTFVPKHPTIGGDIDTPTHQTKKPSSEELSAFDQWLEKNGRK